MKYLYTTKPDEHCNEVEPGVWGRPAHTHEQPKLRKLGWTHNINELKGGDDGLREEGREEKEVGDDLVEQYVELFGKKPHHKLKPETIQEKINEALSDDQG